MIDKHGYKRDLRGKLVHRKKCWKAHGPFPHHWQVHHIDGNKLNNKPKNLIAVPRRVHWKIHQIGQSQGQLPNRKICQRLLNEEMVNHRQSYGKRKRSNLLKQILFWWRK